MNAASIRASVLALACAVTLLVGTATTAAAQNNDQDGLINVFVDDLVLQVPVSVAVPVAVAANVCDINVAVIREDNVTNCTATSTSTALSRAIAEAMLDQAAGNPPNNEQDGLVNVFLSDITIQIPVSVAAPIALAANVCDVNILTLREDNATTCRADADAAADSKAFAKRLARELYE